MIAFIKENIKILTRLFDTRKQRLTGMSELLCLSPAKEYFWCLNCHSFFRSETNPFKSCLSDINLGDFGFIYFRIFSFIMVRLGLGVNCFASVILICTLILLY